MFEKFLSINAGDFRQRYQGTYGFYTRGGKKKLVRLAAVDIDGGVVTFTDKDGASFTLHANAAEDDIGFEFITPKACWHNTKEGAYMVKRVAQRQYQRGISESNTSVTSGKNMKGVYVDFNCLHNIFECPVTIKEASAKGHSFAISDQFFVGEQKLWLFDQAVGAKSVKDGAYTIKLDDPVMFGTEVRDAFRRANLEAVVA